MGLLEWDSSLFEVVVRMVRLGILGTRERTSVLRSDIGVDESTGMQRVEGQPRPENDVMRTFIMFDAILIGEVYT